MKSTGVIRRIDELGRIVIPKEIRRHLGIREGESLEIFTEENKIILKKYSKMLDFVDTASKLCEMVPVMNLGILITDRDKLVSSSNNLVNDLEVCGLPANIMSFIQTRETYESISAEKMNLGNNILEGYFFIQPIISSIDCLGLIIFIKEKAYLKEEKLFAKFLSELIANKIDIS